MSDVTTNADDLARLYRGRIEEWTAAVRTGVRSAILAIERNMVKRLSGAGAPWSYPVPVRTGNLRRSTFVKQPSAVEGIVGNTAAYAAAVHGGKVSEWAGRGKHRTVQRNARPFLDDAVKDADPSTIVQSALRRALGLPA